MLLACFDAINQRIGNMPKACPYAMVLSFKDFTHSHTTNLTQIMQTTAPITYNIFHLPCNSMELGNLFCKKFA